MNALDQNAQARSGKMSKSTVLIVDTGQPDREVIEEMIARTSGFRSEVAPADAATHFPNRYKPDVVMLDLEALTPEAINLLTSIRAIHGDAPIIVVSKSLEADQVRTLLKMKVQDWLTKPLNFKDLQNALHGAVRNFKLNTNKVHAVISAVGGAGATTVAISVADLMAKKIARGSSVGLFDLDFSMGSCGYYLNLQNPSNLDGVINAPSRIDGEFVKLIQQRMNDKFFVYSFKNRGIITHLNCYELVLRLLDVVTLEHTHTVLDIPYYETDWRQDVLSAVNTVTVVSEINLPAVKHTLDLLRSIKELPIDQRFVRVLLNKRRRSLFGGQNISTRKLKELFGTTPFEFLPVDSSVLGEAMDRGLPPGEINSGSRFLKILSRYVSKNLLATQEKK